MKMRLLISFVITLACIATSIAYEKTFSFDGITPPHAVDTAGNAIPESSATQPAKPIIFSKDIPKDNPKWGELMPEAAFDHAKHHTDVLHTIDGKTLTACVECHHTDQPSSPSKPYLKTFDPNWKDATLTAEKLESSKTPVKSCRACHYQKATTPTADYPPKSVKYPKAMWKMMGDQESGDLNNENAYHLRCITCHDAAMNRADRDPKLKAPKGCPDCHIAKAGATASP